MITASHAASHTGPVIHAAAETALLELLGLLLKLLRLLLEAALLRRVLVVVVVFGVLVQDLLFELV